MFFSVIIPLYNKQDYIAKSISSVLNQTYKDFELIIVNDGSTDNSIDVVKTFSDDRITIIEQENQGVTKARERGVLLAKGDFVCFLDADDLLIEETLYSLCLKQKQTNSDLIVASYKKVQDMNVNYHYYSEGLISNYNYLLGLSKYKIHTSPWAKLYRRTLFNSYIFDIPRFVTVGEDLIMDVRFVLSNIDAKIITVSDLMYSYEITSSSVTQQNIWTIQKLMILRHYFTDSFFKYERYKEFKKIVDSFIESQIIQFVLHVSNFNSSTTNRKWIRQNTYAIWENLSIRNKIFCFLSGFYLGSLIVKLLKKKRK